MGGTVADTKRWSKAPKLALWAGEGEGMGRTYVDPETDLRYPSVTTILKNTPKADMLQWVANVVAQKAVDNYAKLGQDPDQVMKWLPYAHNDYRDERAWVGSGVHATIQSDHEGTWEYYELDAEQLRILSKWEKFCKVYKANILLSEKTILGDGYMGTFDAILEWTDPITGEQHVSLIDLKTSKSLHDENWMQLAALANGTVMFTEVPEGTEGAWKRKGKTKKDDSWWIKEPMPEFDSVAIVHLREDSYGLYEPECSLDLYYDEFMCYRDLAVAQQKRKEALRD